MSSIIHHDVRAIASAYQLKRCSAEYKGPCPLCGGKDRFHLKQGHTGLLLHCRNGCSFRDLARAVDLDQRRRPIRPAADISALVNQKPERARTYARAITYWRFASDDDATVADHPYARRKGITHAFGGRRGQATGRIIGFKADCILVPNRDWRGELLGVEAINADGKKQTFGNKGCLILGNPEDSPAIHLCEGWATAWAISQMFARRFGCVVCFGKGLENAHNAVSERFSGRVILHKESQKNLDAWDIWSSGNGADYVRRVEAML